MTIPFRKQIFRPPGSKTGRRLCQVLKGDKVVIEKIDGILGRVGGLATLKLIKKPENGWLEDMLYFFFGGMG